jgi:hypothetical protein
MHGRSDPRFIDLSTLFAIVWEWLKSQQLRHNLSSPVPALSDADLPGLIEVRRRTKQPCRTFGRNCHDRTCRAVTPQHQLHHATCNAKFFRSGTFVWPYYYRIILLDVRSLARVVAYFLLGHDVVRVKLPDAQIAHGLRRSA